MSEALNHPAHSNAKTQCAFSLSSLNEERVGVRSRFLISLKISHSTRFSPRERAGVRGKRTRALHKTFAQSAATKIQFTKLNQS